MLHRGTTNGNSRGSAEDRRRRRAYLVARYGWPDLGIVLCWRCQVPLLQDEDPDAPGQAVTVDRIVLGADGGRYTRDNIRPACGPCNSETGGRAGGIRVQARARGALTHAPTRPPGVTSPTYHPRHVTAWGITGGDTTHGSTHATHGAGAVTGSPPSTEGDP